MNFYKHNVSNENVKNLKGDNSLFIDGYLPTGIKIDFYIYQSFDGELKFITDDEEIYSEVLKPHKYNCSKLHFRHLRYATADKKATVTLVLSLTRNVLFNLSFYPLNSILNLVYFIMLSHSFVKDIILKIKVKIKNNINIVLFSQLFN